MIPRLIDSHCHLDLEPLRGELAPVLSEAAAAGVRGFVVPGVHPGGWPAIAELALRHPNILPAYGIHPMHAGIADDAVLEQLQLLAARGVALGEIGLDPAYPVPLEIQERLFREQLRIAAAAGLPVLIHCRRVFQRVAQLLREERAGLVGGVMHAFSGSPEMAREFIRLGFAISISGTVTWQNAVRPLRIARELPLEHLVLESDAPDMTPQRYRGAFNRPAWLTETALKVAGVRDIPLEEVALATTANICCMLRLREFPA